MNAWQLGHGEHMQCDRQQQGPDKSMVTRTTKLRIGCQGRYAGIAAALVFIYVSLENIGPDYTASLAPCAFAAIDCRVFPESSLNAGLGEECFCLLVLRYWHLGDVVGPAHWSP